MDHSNGAGPKSREAGAPATVLSSSSGRGWRDLEAAFLRIPAGLTHVPGAATVRLGIHFGRPVNADCRCGGLTSRRVQSHGDIDVVPAGCEGTWQDDADCSILRLYPSQALLRRTALELGRDPDALLDRPTLQLRDARLASVAWAIKAELESEAPADGLYAETLAVALAVALLQARPMAPRPEADAVRTLSPRQRRRLAEHIEAHLCGPLSLADLAGVAGLGVSQLKVLFRGTFGVPPHRYVIRRRVERAQALLLSTDTPLSQVALEAGFAHQSHLARCMREVLGTTPGAIARIRR